MPSAIYSGEEIETVLVRNGFEKLHEAFFEFDGSDQNAELLWGRSRDGLLMQYDRYHEGDQSYVPAPVLYFNWMATNPAYFNSSPSVLYTNSGETVTARDYMIDHPDGTKKVATWEDMHSRYNYVDYYDVAVPITPWSRIHAEFHATGVFVGNLTLYRPISHDLRNLDHVLELIESRGEFLPNWVGRPFRVLHSEQTKQTGDLFEDRIANIEYTRNLGRSLPEPFRSNFLVPYWRAF